MTVLSSRIRPSRREFACWIGLGILGISRELHARLLDDLADAAATSTENAPTIGPARTSYWIVGENRRWRWYERQTSKDGDWSVTGITTPFDRETGERYTGMSGYLDDEIVPLRIREWTRHLGDEDSSTLSEEIMSRTPDDTRRARDGRPPSAWLRGLDAIVLRRWLRVIEVPEAGVSGMTFWTHLTRDHSFSPANLEGLTSSELAKLHGAAHFGY